MQFSGNSDKQDLYSDYRRWIGIPTTDTTTSPIEDFTSGANFALDRVVSLILRSDGSWKWQDNNQSNLIIGTQDLVANQEDYSITISHLKIKKLRIKDPEGNWVSLEPKGRSELTDGQLTATAGTPTTYSKIGNSYFLNPIPSYSSTGGLEIEFQKGASYFDVTYTTVEPGIASQFHRLISLYAALDYCAVNGLTQRSTIIQNRITVMEPELVEYYSSRGADIQPHASFRQDDYGESGL